MMHRYLGVKEAADALGVHPQTVRGWTRRGILSAIRLPGSGYRRYMPEEIDRVRQAMASESSAPEPLTLDDPLFELDGAGASGSTDTVSRLHEEIGDAVIRHESRKPRRVPFAEGARRRAGG